ncbi:hypothetical protein GE09DRAFT_1105246, partial [Coniochaeta sp. 2T2.1]
HLVSPQATGLGARPRRFSVTGGGLPSYSLAAVRLRDNRHFSVGQFYLRILRRPCRTNQIRTCLLTVLGWNHFVMRDLRPYIHFGGSLHRTPTVTLLTGADDTKYRALNPRILYPFLYVCITSLDPPAGGGSVHHYLYHSLQPKLLCKSQGRSSVRVGQFKGQITALLKTETRS